MFDKILFGKENSPENILFLSKMNPRKTKSIANFLLFKYLCYDGENLCRKKLILHLKTSRQIKKKM